MSPACVGTLTVFLLLPLLSGQTRSENVRPRIEQEPKIARIELPGQTPLILRGRLDRNRARQMERLARAVQQDVARRFLSDRDKSGLDPVALCLFGSTRSYQAFVREVFGEGHDVSDWGFYSPGLRLVVANIGASRGNLRHELVHALLDDDFPDIPAWLNEGLGSLYGTASQTRQGFRFLVNYRLRHLRRALGAGLLPGLEELAGSGRQDVYGRNSLAYYAVSRYLLLYLDRRGKLEEFVRKLRRGALTPERQLRLLQEYVDFGKFLRWTRKLRIKPKGRS